MISLLDYVGTGSRVGRKNIIWTKVIFFFSNAGEGFFSQLSPDRIIFSGYISSLPGVEALKLDIRLLNDRLCDVTFGAETTRNAPYFTEDNTFVVDIPRGYTIRMSRYNVEETDLNLYTFGSIEPPVYGTYHFQPV